MNEEKNSPSCEGAMDLIAFLYREMDERESRDFQLHLQECGKCREEAASLGVVRESIGAWRDEVLAGFVATPVTMKAPSKSALAALRQFFDLSPLWLKGATAFAIVTFCVLAALAVVRLNRNNDQLASSNPKPDAIYTQSDVDRIVKEALAQQPKTQQRVESQPEVVVTKNTPKKARPSVSSQVAKSRRPLSKAEREQLAADLRLLSDPDDPTLHLLGDRINQE